MLISKTYNLLLIIGALLIIVLSQISFYEIDNLVNYLCISLILTLGILHGSYDLELHKKQPLLKHKKMFLRLAIYLIIIGLLAILYSVSPTLLLYGFILASAYHFGEEVVSYKVSKLKLRHKIWSVCYGMTILFGLFYFHIEQVIEILIKLEVYAFAKAVSLTVFILCFILQFQLSLRETVLLKQPYKLFFKEQLEILLILIIFASTPILVGFTIFFIFWHSLPSINSQIKTVYGKVSTAEIKLYLKKSGFIYAISIMGIIGLLYILKPENSLKVIIITGLCVSVPHILTIASISKEV